MPSSPSLQIAIVGVGGIGSSYAFYLARSGHAVTVIARPSSTRLQQLRRDNAIINLEGERADVTVADALDEQTQFDLVIVTLQAHQIDAVLPTLQRGAAKCVQFMFNMFDPERIRDAMGDTPTAFGMPFVQATVLEDGKLRSNIGRASLMSRQESVDIFRAAGLPAILEPHMILWLRCHAPICVALESVCFAGMQRGGGASWQEATVLAQGVHECFALIQRLGYNIYPGMKVWLNRSPTWVVAGLLYLLSRIKPFRELLAGGVNEARYLTDSMVAAASQAKKTVVVSTIQAMRAPEKPTLTS